MNNTETGSYRGSTFCINTYLRSGILLVSKIGLRGILHGASGNPASEETKNGDGHDVA